MRHRIARTFALACLAIGCGGKEPQARETASATATHPPATAFTGRRLRGDQAGVRAWLTSVRSTGDDNAVRWKPSTVRVSREAALRSLQAVSDDGADYTFDASEPSVASLAPGRVLFIWGTALRKVTAVDRAATGLVVHTAPAPLTEAIDDANLAFAFPREARGFVTLATPDPAAPARTSAAPWAAPGDGRAPLRYASLRPIAPGPPTQEGAEPGEGHATESEGEGGYDYRRAGSVGSWEYDLAWTRVTGGLDFELGVKRSVEGPEAVGTDEAKDQAKEQAEATKAAREKAMGGKGKKEEAKGIEGPSAAFALDLTGIVVTVKGHVDDLGGGGKLVIAHGEFVEFALEKPHIGGTLDFDWKARLGAPGTYSDNAKLKLPVSYKIPIVVAGLPLMLELGGGLLVAPALTSKYASAHGRFTLTFDTQAGVSLAGVEPDASGGGLLQVAKDAASNVTSLGVSGIMVAMQFPRVGLGMGVFGTYGLAYVDLVWAGNEVATGGLGLIQCQKFQLNATGGAGVIAEFLGVKIPGSDQKKVWKEEVFHWSIPEGAKCG